MVRRGPDEFRAELDAKLQAKSATLVALNDLRIEQEHASLPIQELLIPITTIVREPVLMMRVKQDGATVKKYADAMVAGSVFPPVEIMEVDGRLLLTGGFHRTAAVELNGGTTILAHVRSGTMQDAILAAARADAHDGLKRTNADKRKTAEALLLTDWGKNNSDGMVADAAGVSQPFVSKLRAELRASTQNGYELPAKRKGKDGKVRSTESNTAGDGDPHGDDHNHQDGDDHRRAGDDVHAGDHLGNRGHGDPPEDDGSRPTNGAGLASVMEDEPGDQGSGGDLVAKGSKEEKPGAADDLPPAIADQHGDAHDDDDDRRDDGGLSEAERPPSPPPKSGKRLDRKIAKIWNQGSEAERASIWRLARNEYFALATGTEIFVDLPETRRAAVFRDLLDRLTVDGLLAAMSPQFGAELRKRVLAPKVAKENIKKGKPYTRSITLDPNQISTVSGDPAGDPECS